MLSILAPTLSFSLTYPPRYARFSTGAQHKKDMPGNAYFMYIAYPASMI
jgi:hypothetical protein